MDIKKLLKTVIERKASDLHLSPGNPPILRVERQLRRVGEGGLSEEEVKDLVFSLLSPEQKEELSVNKELDFSTQTQEARFRVNAFFERGKLTAAFRAIPLEVPSIDELNLPEVLHDFVKLPQGFVLVTGPAGQGKSTTIASVVEEINQTRSVHVITIEDPIEYVFQNKKALIAQREMGLDTLSWARALRSAVREDPDVVFIGEMRDLETISSAVTIAETGHLVFATLHTNSAAQTIDRIIDVFPEAQQAQVRTQLGSTLEGIVCERLLPKIGGGLVPACEILLASPAVRNTIRVGKTHQIPNIIATSKELGMQSLEWDLARLVREGKVEREVAEMRTVRPEELARLLR